jgi:hypothetical protein
MALAAAKRAAMNRVSKRADAGNRLESRYPLNGIQVGIVDSVGPHERTPTL